MLEVSVPLVFLAPVFDEIEVTSSMSIHQNVYPWNHLVLNSWSVDNIMRSKSRHLWLQNMEALADLSSRSDPFGRYV